MASALISQPYLECFSKCAINNGKRYIWYLVLWIIIIINIVVVVVAVVMATIGV